MIFIVNSMDRVLFSRKSDNWATPRSFLIERGFVGWYDPCPLGFNGDVADDGLKHSWFGKVFVNPPYSEIRLWIEKAIEQSEHCERIVLLVPARTDTRWFHDLVYCRYTIVFLRGRLKFGDGKNSAPFPSMLVFIK